MKLTTKIYTPEEGLQTSIYELAEPGAVVELVLSQEQPGQITFSVIVSGAVKLLGKDPPA